jgi:reverse gyrase
MSNLFIPRLRAHALSAPVGSGKTRAATAWLASPTTAARNVLYVAPTMALVEQTTRNLLAAIEKAGSGTVRNVNKITSRDVARGQVAVEVLQEPAPPI